MISHQISKVYFINVKYSLQIYYLFKAIYNNYEKKSKLSEKFNIIINKVIMIISSRKFDCPKNTLDTNSIIMRTLPPNRCQKFKGVFHILYDAGL